MDSYDNQLLALGVAVLFVLLILLMCFSMAIWVKLTKMRRRYKQLIGETQEGSSIEQVISDLQEISDKIERQQNGHKAQLEEIQQTLSKIKANVGIVRYNAFHEQGNDLSFSLAMINNSQDGVVISGIYGREQTYIYAKPLHKGQSKYAVTTEEKQAIELALSSEMP